VVALILIMITALICAFCVWKAMQEPKVLSIVVATTPTKDRR